ncbi:PAS domain S-box protein [Lyngbya aestuarii]|uniref:PAS domain S-box protein n=1 Tax=Lyngbya aestuarii TaxID=118322 RepID=UPI00403DB0A6
MLNQVLSVVSDLVFVQDPLGRFTYINSPGAQTLGFEPNYFLGKTFVELGFPDSVTEWFTAKLQVVCSTKLATSGEMSVPTIQGIKDYEHIFSPVQRTDGGIEAIVCISRDITERKQTERALRHSEAKYRNLFECSGDSIFIMDAETLQLLDANWNGVRQLGYTRQELLKLSLADLEAPMAASRRQSLLQQLEHEGSVIYEHALRCKDGSQIIAEIHTQVIEYGERLAFQCFGRNITECKQAKVALKESEAGYRRLIETAQEGIWIIDADALTSFVSPRMAQMLGYTVEEMLDTHLFDFIDEEVQAIAEVNLERSYQNIKEQHQFRFRRKDGSPLWTIVSTSPIFNEEGQYQGALAMITDLTNIGDSS